jgi:hypothetical protein
MTTVLARAGAVWVVLIVSETIHGTLRELLLRPYVGDLRARQIGVFTGMLIILGVASGFIRWIRAETSQALWLVGMVWVALTVSFEFSVGLFVLGYSWERMLEDYDVTQGGFLAFGMVVLLLSPRIAARWREPRTIRVRAMAGGTPMSASNDYDRAVRAVRQPAAARRGVWDATELVRYATLAASSHNTQPWTFRVGPDSITILPDYSRRCPVVDPDDSHLFKSLGCAAENLVHAAAAQGCATDVRFEPTEDAVVVRMTPALDATASELFSAITKRQCARTEYDGRPLTSDELAALVRAGDGHGVRMILLRSDAEKERVVDFVTQGNDVQLRDPAFRDELVSWIRFNPRSALRTGDGLAGRASGQPSLPTWLAKSLIGLVLSPQGQARTDARNIRSSACIAVFVTGRDDKAGWVDTGRAYERFALQATALDIRTAFINQPIEVPSLRPRFEAWLKLDGERALLVVRCGHGPAVPFSPRRPLDDVIIHATPTVDTGSIASDVVGPARPCLPHWTTGWIACEVENVDTDCRR